MAFSLALPEEGVMVFDRAVSPGEMLIK